MLGADVVRELASLETSEQLPDGENCDSGRFEIMGDLGGGAYGTVYKARDRTRQGQIVALKKMHIREDPDIGIPPFVMREVSNLKRLSEPPDGREPYIVRYERLHSRAVELVVKGELRKECARGCPSVCTMC